MPRPSANASANPILSQTRLPFPATKGLSTNVWMEVSSPGQKTPRPPAVSPQNKPYVFSRPLRLRPEPWGRGPALLPINTAQPLEAAWQQIPPLSYTPQDREPMYPIRIVPRRQLCVHSRTESPAVSTGRLRGSVRQRGPGESLGAFRVVVRGSCLCWSPSPQARRQPGGDAPGVPLPAWAWRPDSEGLW